MCNLTIYAVVLLLILSSIQLCCDGQALGRLDKTSPTLIFTRTDNFGYLTDETSGNELLLSVLNDKMGDFPDWEPLAKRTLNILNSIDTTSWNRWADWVDEEGNVHQDDSYEAKYGNCWLSAHGNWRKILTKKELFGKWSYGKVDYGILISKDELMVAIGSVHVGSCSITGPIDEVIAMLF